MAKYILKRNYFTQWGTFRPSPGGVEIPDHIVGKFGLPKDAKPLDASYVPEDDARKLLPHEVVARDNQARLASANGERDDEIETRRTEFEEAGGHIRRNLTNKAPDPTPAPEPTPELTPAPVSTLKLPAKPAAKPAAKANN